MFIKKAKPSATQRSQELLFVADNMPYALATLKRCQTSGLYTFSDDFLEEVAHSVVTNLNKSLRCQHRGTHFDAIDKKSEANIVSHLKAAMADFQVTEAERMKLSSRESYLKRELVGTANGGRSLISTITGQGVNTTNLSHAYYQRSATNLISVLCHFISNLLGNSADNPLSVLSVKESALSSEVMIDHVQRLVTTTVKEVLEKSSVEILIDDHVNDLSI